MGKRNEIPDCTCDGSYPFKGGIRCLTCAPLTDMELHRLERARESGKVKPPSWWRPFKMPTKPAVDLRQKYPPYVLAMFTRQSDPFLEWNLPDAAESTAQYVREFCELNNLKGA